MLETVFWMPGFSNFKLGIMARPRGGEWLNDSIGCLSSQGVDLVLSLLEDQEIVELELEREGDFCKEYGIKFFRFPIPDRKTPESFSKVNIFLKKIKTELNNPESRMVIHCRMGVGRAAIIAAAIMMVHEMHPETALLQIQNARGVSVPDTQEQKKWVIQFWEYFSHSE